jgi:hypothetical protein
VFHLDSKHGITYMKAVKEAHPALLRDSPLAAAHCRQSGRGQQWPPSRRSPWTLLSPFSPAWGIHAPRYAVPLVSSLQHTEGHANRHRDTFQSLGKGQRDCLGRFRRERKGPVRWMTFPQV